MSQLSEWAYQFTRVRNHQDEQAALAERQRQDVVRKAEHRAQLTRDRAEAELAPHAARAAPGSRCETCNLEATTYQPPIGWCCGRCAGNERAHQKLHSRGSGETQS